MCFFECVRQSCVSRFVNIWHLTTCETPVWLRSLPRCRGGRTRHAPHPSWSSPRTRREQTSSFQRISIVTAKLNTTPRFVCLERAPDLKKSVWLLCFSFFFLVRNLVVIDRWSFSLWFVRCERRCTLLSHDRRTSVSRETVTELAERMTVTAGSGGNSHVLGW